MRNKLMRKAKGDFCHPINSHPLPFPPPLLFPPLSSRDWRGWLLRRCIMAPWCSHGPYITQCKDPSSSHNELEGTLCRGCQSCICTCHQLCQCSSLWDSKSSDTEGNSHDIHPLLSLLSVLVYHIHLSLWTATVPVCLTFELTSFSLHNSPQVPLLLGTN